jgi:hypothetical protein
MRTVLANVALLHSCLLHWAITTGLGQQRVALESSGIECFAMMLARLAAGPSSSNSPCPWLPRSPSSSSTENPQDKANINARHAPDNVSPPTSPTLSAEHWKQRYRRPPETPASLPSCAHCNYTKSRKPG